MTRRFFTTGVGAIGAGATALAQIAPVTLTDSMGVVITKGNPPFVLKNGQCPVCLTKRPHIENRPSLGAGTYTLVRCEGKRFDGVCNNAFWQEIKPQGDL